MERNLALEFVRVTEAGAIASALWTGKGQKKKADGAAVDAMRVRFNSVDFKGEIIIGEGEKDEAPMLYVGEEIGTGKGEEIDIAIDPLEGTSLTAKGQPGAISVLAAGPKGSFLKAPGTYMEQLVVGPKARGHIDIKKPLEVNLGNIAKALGKPIQELMVCILDRDRHKEHLATLRKLECRVWLIDHGTVGAGLATCMPESPIDVLIGTGGAPEAVLTAAGLQCFGGEIQAQLKPHDEKTMQQAMDFGFTDLSKVFNTDDLAKADNVCFVATGVTGGSLLDGVIFEKEHIITHSIVMRSKSKTVRFLKTFHHNEVQ